jgi:uncharacterized protein (TIGR02246 family)
MFFLAGPARAVESDRAAIEALNERWVGAYRNGDYAAIPELYTEDALIMPRGRPAIEGRQRLAEQLGGLAGGRQVEIGFTIRELEILGEYAWLVSTFSVTYTPPDDPQGSHTEHGRSLILYRKDADGQWRIHRDMDSPAPAPGSAPMMEEKKRDQSKGSE